MSHRGSFSNCVSAMSILFSQNRYEILHVVQKEAGKYYILMTNEELESHKQTPSNLLDRVVLSITNKELRLLHEYKQKDLFSG
jgi:hypothetical protein